MIRFALIASWTSRQMGHPLAFAGSCIVVLLWALSGPMFHYSDTWQLIINTGTTVVTFLAVFLIQHSQNRDMIAVQLKLDELIRATDQAHNQLMALEDRSDPEIAAVRAQLHGGDA